MYGLYNQPQIMSSLPQVVNSNSSQVIGSLAQAQTYNDVQSAPVAANGSPTLFMMENKPVMYIVSMQNGQKVIQGFKFEPLPTQQETMENRMNNLETMLLNMQSMLEGKMNNESNIANAKGKSATCTEQPNVAAGK